MNHSSSRHHYIPKFLISAFTNSDGLLYVYDKKKDIIFPNPRSTKSVFFEENRNNVPITNNESSSILEDVFFQKIDNDTSKFIRQLQSNDIENSEILSVKNQGSLQFFLINLFWRLPYTDIAFERLYNESTIISPDIDPEILRKDEAFKKMHRAFLYKKTIDEMDDSLSTNKYYGNIKEFDRDVFIIGDNPILFETIPYTFKHLTDLEYLFALSSRRIYSLKHNKLFNFTLLDSLKFNALIIDQSVRYVCSGDKYILNLAVEYSKTIDSIANRENLRAYLFK